jgi:hypothetical protein
MAKADSLISAIRALITGASVKRTTNPVSEVDAILERPAERAA